jgi:hypothetical protein
MVSFTHCNSCFYDLKLYLDGFDLARLEPPAQGGRPSAGRISMTEASARVIEKASNSPFLPNSPLTVTYSLL